MTKTLENILDDLKEWEAQTRGVFKESNNQQKIKRPRDKNNPSWGTIRKRILHRDESRCRICNKDYELHVHHIDYNRKNNIEKNLVTLCSVCHKALHDEEYKPSEHPNQKPPWEKNSLEQYDEMNQEYSW